MSATYVDHRLARRARAWLLVLLRCPLAPV